MKDTVHDAPAGQREHDQNNIPPHVKDLEIEFGSRPPSFTTVNKDFGIDNQDVPGLHADRIAPNRRRMLLLACICILGEAQYSVAVEQLHAASKQQARSEYFSSTTVRHAYGSCLVVAVLQATSYVRGEPGLQHELRSRCLPKAQPSRLLLSGQEDCCSCSPDFEQAWHQQAPLSETAFMPCHAPMHVLGPMTPATLGHMPSWPGWPQQCCQ
jgi:hypothetical protein